MTQRASIIVRSMARKELHDALASLAAQTHPDLEIIVVAASGPEHPAPPSRCGTLPVRFVPATAPRSRSAAANAGLAVATGAFIGLLDDDDLLLPTHVATLTSVLYDRPGIVAAYSIALEVDATGALVNRRAQTYSRLLLFQDCYIASNTVLFRREVCADCCFDERFDICEDWDFWLQLAERSDFAFAPVETAVVRPAAGTSGTGHGPNRDDARYREARAMLASKWMTAGRAVAARIDAVAHEALDLYAKGCPTEAESAADRVLEAYPFEVAMLNLKGTLLALRGDTVGALERFQRATAEAPTDVASGLNLARALDRLGRAKEAISAYDRVLVLAPGQTQAAARRATLERQRNGAVQ